MAIIQHPSKKFETMVPIVEVTEFVSSAGPCTLKPLKDFQFMKPSELMQIGCVWFMQPVNFFVNFMII